MTIKIVWGALVAAGIAGAQALVPCPANGLDVDTVLKLVGRLPDSNLIELVTRCHTAFAPEQPLFDRLENAGATAPVLDALFSDGIGRLTLAQAHREVAARERKLEENERSVNARRDRELMQLDSDYQLRRDRAAQVSAQGQFENDATYQGRLRAAATARDELERTHQADREGIDAKYTDELKRLGQRLHSQVAALKERTYPIDPMDLVFAAYLPNDDRLAATINGEEYWFTIPNKPAEVLHGRWNTAKVMQNYEEATPPTRYLVDTVTGVSFPGISRAAAESIERDRQAEIERQRQAEIARQHQAEIDRQLKAEAAAAESKRQDELAKVGWADPRTRLVWTLSDNGQDVNWKGANEYCAALRTGGFSDWRLATIDELKTIYDPASSRKTAPLPSSRTYWNGGAPLRVKAGSYWIYHIKGGIELTSTGVWSGSSKDGYKDLMWWISFLDGKTAWDGTGDKKEMRTLCVRPNEP